MGKSFSELANCLKNKTDGIVLSTLSLVSDELELSQYFCFSLATKSEGDSVSSSVKFG